jgi:hypothetical protein
MNKQRVCEAFHRYGESSDDCEWLIDELPLKACHGVRGKYIFFGYYTVDSTFYFINKLLGGKADG